MKFENLTCDGCGRQFEKNDDIVVCPVCGTPQHRTCYELNGGCINKDKHEEGFEWKEPERAETPSEKQTKTDFVPPVKEMPSFSMNAENGIPDFDYVVETRVQALAPGISPEQRQEKLCGHFISDTIAFIGNNASSYVSKFRKKEHLNKNTFNFGAFFFSPIWFFWRRLYKPGIIYLAISVCLTMLMAAPSENYMTLLESFMSSGAEAITDAQYNELVSASAPIMLYGLVTIIMKLIAGFTGDRLYYKYCKNTLDEVDVLKKNSDNSTLLNFYLKRSSTGILVTVIAMAVYYFLPSILMSLFVSV